MYLPPWLRKAVGLTPVDDRPANDFFASLNRLPLAERERLVARATLHLSAEIDSFNNAELALLKRLRDNGRLSTDEASHAKQLAEAADNRYFELNQAGASAEQSLPDFTKARIFAGLALGCFSAGRRPNAAEAFRELSSAAKDPAELLAYTQAELARMTSARRKH